MEVTLAPFQAYFIGPGLSRASGATCRAMRSWTSRRCRERPCAALWATTRTRGPGSRATARPNHLRSPSSCACACAPTHGPPWCALFPPFNHSYGRWSVVIIGHKAQMQPSLVQRPCHLEGGPTTSLLLTRAGLDHAVVARHPISPMQLERM